jgi:hypothetical protein
MTTGCIPITPNIVSKASFKPLSDVEIRSFIEELDTNKDGFVTFEELTTAFEDVQAEIVTQSATRLQGHVERESVRLGTIDLERGKEETNPEQYEIQNYLRSLLPGSGSLLSTDELMEHIKSWNIPSQNQNCAEDQDLEINQYHQKLSVGRRARAYWAINGPKKLFRCLVIILQLTFGLWQLVTYVNRPKDRAAFGWGILVAKGSAGVLYPTMFFM